MNRRSQVFNLCLICNKKNGTYLLCEVCRKNPFFVEEARSKAGLMNSPLFQHLYSTVYSEIEDKNTKDFWNKKFDIALCFEDQDRMTREKITRIVSLLPKKRLMILDIGFGQGYFEELISIKKSISIVGVDISSQAIKRARKKFQGKFIEGDLHEINKLFKQSSFDVVIAIEVVEHISPTKIFDFFSNVRKLLKENGILIISTPLNEHLRTIRDNPSGHVREYTIPVLKKELELSGFRVTDIHTFYAFRRFYTIKKLLSKILRNHCEPNNVVVKVVKI